MTRPRDALHRRSLDAQDLVEAELLAGLWEHAAFPRLPYDAPPALEDLLEDIENPRRVYTVYRASRRHNFQSLVQKFVVQLRDGCGSSTCETSSCFSCRRRVVGKAPIRRYNTTSARTMAVFLASQDNPESALCPSLRTPKTPPAALNSLVFSAKPGGQGSSRLSPTVPGRGPVSKGKAAVLTPPTTSPRWTERRPSHDQETLNSKGVSSSGSASDSRVCGSTEATELSIAEKPVSKDHRSFAANMFGTVAFKMLEWLTPAGLDEMSRRASELGVETGKKAEDRPRSPTSKVQRRDGKDRNDQSPPREAGPAADSSVSKPAADTPPSLPSTPAEKPPPPAENAAAVEVNGDKAASRPPAGSGTSSSKPGVGRRNSSARVRTSSAAKPKRSVSIDTFSAEQAAAADELLSALRSPRLPTLPQDKTSRTALKSATSTIPRPISQLSNTGVLDGVPLEKMPPPSTTAASAKSSSGGRLKPGGQGQTEGGQAHDGESGDRNSRSPLASSSSDRSYVAVSPCESDSAFEPEYRHFLPQSISRLSPELVDFFCDVLQDDGTVETHMLLPSTVPRTNQVRQGISLSHSNSHRGGAAERLNRTPTSDPYPSDLLYRWMVFIEQSFFYVLSDPRRLIRSFTKKGQLYDSQTLWYCMLRMSRVAPTVVMHSLWQAADALFVPPAGVVSSLPTAAAARLFPLQQRGIGPTSSGPPLSNSEAGLLLSICLHLLVALAPVAVSKEELHDMSRLRAHGLVVTRKASASGSGTASAPLCLAFNEAFTNDLALRLARRLFAAIPTRQYFDELAALDDVTDISSADASIGMDELLTPNVLTPLFQQLDFLNADIMYILPFSLPHRAVHEVRAPSLLLDWARNVMLQEWDGRPEVPSDGPFGGALALIKAMYQKRRPLVLADGQFLADYFAERIDEVDVPVAWLTFTPTRQKAHLLDFPYIFTSAKLVSFFRSINFSRMSRAYEESSSLQERMNAIAPPRGSLIVNPHHRHVLQDMLRTASARFLVISVGRDNVLEDAFNQLWRREERELSRPLKVKLGEGRGEEGFDSGGVQQEFFRLAVAEALDPVFGAFTVDDRTRMTWFNPASPEPDWKFEMVGLLFSLAVYNGLTLPVTFPEALYRKLLGEPVSELHHISDGWPDLASGLTALLDWDEKDGAVEDVFARTYEFSISAFGEPVSREMKGPNAPGGGGEWPAFPAKHSFGGATGFASSSSSSLALQEGNPPDAPLVTRDNRDAYVADYIRYLTDVSVRSQYEAFSRGFRACLNAKSLTLLTPKLLQSLVEGVQEIDVAELRRHARYVGWDASHRGVRDFWAVVRRFDGDMLRRLLEFVTASDRVPVGGMKNVQFVVQRNGQEEDERGHLPTAYTCYGTLLLPEYPNREILRERLCMALMNAQGFGFA